MTIAARVLMDSAGRDAALSPKERQEFWGDNSMILESRVLEFTRSCLRRHVGQDEYVRGKLESELRGEAAALVQELERDLQANERARFLPYAQMFSRNDAVNDHNIAEALLWGRVAELHVRLWNEAMIAGRFSDSRLSELAPEVASMESADKHGLVPTRSLERLRDAFRFSGLALWPSERIPWELRRRLIELSGDTKFEMKIRLSPYCVRPLAEYSDDLRKAKVTGCYFDVSLLRERVRDRKANMETVLVRPEGEARLAALCRPVERLVASRKDNGGMISLMAEELVPFPNDENSEYVRTLILHCDIRVDRDEFQHVDASVLVYRRSTYERRLKARVQDKVPAEGHYKLFWIAKCSVSLWSEIFELLLPDNELVTEYLTGRHSQHQSPATP